MQIPLRTRTDTDVTKISSADAMMDQLNKENEDFEMVSDEYDSDSKENEQVK